MNKSLRRRVAAVATTATVGGLLLPFLAAGSALAAPITSLTVTPTSANSGSDIALASRTTIFTGGFVGGAPIGTGKVSAVAITGPDALAAPVNCPITGTTYKCTFINGATPGTDAMRFFYDSAGGAVYSAALPSASATLTIAGPVSKVVLTPTSSSAAQNGYSGYTVSASDAAGRPAAKTSVSITATEANTANADISVVPGPKPVPYNTAGNPTPPNVLVPTGTQTLVTQTADGTAGTVAGNADFYVASKVLGTVNLSVSTNPANPAISATGTLTVNKGLTVDDVAAVTIAPSAQRAFTGDTASIVVNLRNAQGNPISGVTPAVQVTAGPNANAVVTFIPANGKTDGDGNVTATYPSANSGNDTVVAFVNQSTNPVNTSNLDAGEPSATASVTVAPSDVFSIKANGPFMDPLSATTTLITYTVVAKNGGSPAGYAVKFALVPAVPAKGVFTLSATSAVTDASGKASVTLTNANPADGDNTKVSGTTGFAPNVLTDSAMVTYSASAVAAHGLKISPFANTITTTGKASFSASATDQFGNAATGLTFNWVVSGRNNTVNNAGALGAGITFMYSDVGAVAAEGQDLVTLQATDANNNVLTTTANQYWVTTPAKATQANIDFDFAGKYTENRTGVPFGQSGPIVASGFNNKAIAAVTKDPTAAAPVVATTAVHVLLTDAANHRLYGKSVSFSSTGVGVFTDAQGNPVNSATALVADGTAVGQDFNYKNQFNGSVADYATAFVRSTQAGTQAITATVDGVTSTATVVYSGQFVGITPVRVMDTRTGQGGLYTGAGTTAPVGPLAPDTSYTLDYAAAGMPLGNEAYVFNVTAIKPSGVGNLRVAPGGVSAVAPTTSLVNYQSGSDVANAVIVSNVGGNDSLQLYSATSRADVAVDLVGYYPTAAGVTSTAPSRIVDTRIGATPVAAGETRSFQVAGQGGLPGTTAKAVALNVTVVNPSSLGNLRVFADGDAVPTTSNINYIPGQDKSAFVIVNLPANGKISVYSAGTPVDVAIDAYASFDKVTSNIVTQTPVRILDTRITGNPIAANGVQDLQVVGTAGVPATAQAVLVSITGIHTAGSLGSGNLGVFPAGGSVPIISTLNYVSPTADVANFAIVKLGANGKITIDSMGSPTDVAVDVLGYVPAG